MSRNYLHYLKKNESQGLFDHTHTLDLSGEKLEIKVTDQEISNICKFLLKHPNVTTLKLDHNNLYGLPNESNHRVSTRALAKVPTLFHLDLSHNHLSEDAIIPLASGKFTSLNISSNHYGESERVNRIFEMAHLCELASSASLFAKNKYLVRLDINHNDLSPGYIEKILVENTHLRMLNVLGNQVNDRLIHLSKIHPSICQFEAEVRREIVLPKSRRCTIV